ncbi:MAG: HD domain-containing protein [Bacteroidales bacterium]|nr:HD domain-containing protein [Bacteroidales bacterium]
MNLTSNIYSAELNLRQPAEDFFIRIWGNTRLPSHDIDHHRRVWHYAKELLQKTEECRGDNFSFSPDQLLLACYFHDIGMSVDRGIKHGKHGKDIFLRFLSEHRIDAETFKDALDAVENHDDKDYTAPANPNDLINFLSASDDMDAFGYAGIYRYIEIYLNRNFKPHVLGNLIRENASKRFANLKRNYGFLKNLITRQEKRYKIIDNFFTAYNEQVTCLESGDKNQFAEYGLVEEIGKLICNNLNISDVLTDPLLKPGNAEVRNYLQKIQSELKTNHFR